MSGIEMPNLGDTIYVQGLTNDRRVHCQLDDVDGELGVLVSGLSGHDYLWSLALTPTEAQELAVTLTVYARAAGQFGELP